MDIGKHPASNFTYKAPANMPDCQDLHVVRTAEGSASLWIPDAVEREAIRAGHPVMLMVYGSTHPPVSVGVDIGSKCPVTPAPDRDAQDAERWRKLVRLCGHWQDGSDTVVKLTQDDATRQCLITVDGQYNGPTGFGGSFEQALSLLIDPKDEESTDARPA